MTAIGFYHLTRTGAEAALPALLGRTLAAGEAALVRASAERIAALDAAFWLSQNPDWLPHGTALTPHPEWQPIYLAADAANPAGARFLFLLDGGGGESLGGSAAGDLAAFTRVFDLFDGNDETAVQAARDRWRAAKAAGFETTYWQQGGRGWEKAG